MKQHTRSTLRSALIAAGCLAGVSAWAITPGAASNDLGTPAPKPSVSAQQGNDYGNAADKGADTNKVQPSQEAVQQRANQPSPSVLDDNAQRQHDRDQGSTQRPSDDTAGTTHQGPSSDNAGAASGSISSDSSASPSSGSGMSSSSNADTSGGSMTTRDWDKIDTNHDGSVSPQEMDTWLQNNRSQGGSTQQPAPQK
jgi:hypothetical protein